MQKKELIQKLNDYVEHDMCEWKGQRAFALFLIEYLQKLDLSSHEKYDFWDIDPYIPQVLFDAFEELRIGTDEYVVKHRNAYEEEVAHEVPNLVDVGASNVLDRVSAVQTTLGNMMAKILDCKNIRSQIESYLNAQFTVLQHTFDKFIQLVYRKGLYEIITNCGYKGMEGKFGHTELRSYAMAGRLMFTFAREKGESEINLTFIGQEDDPQFYSSGMQSVHANFVDCLLMINGVIDLWPKNKEEQSLVFRPNEEIMLDVMAAMR